MEEAPPFQEDLEPTPSFPETRCDFPEVDSLQGQIVWGGLSTLSRGRGTDGNPLRRSVRHAFDLRLEDLLTPCFVRFFYEAKTVLGWKRVEPMRAKELRDRSPDLCVRSRRSVMTPGKREVLFNHTLLQTVAVAESLLAKRRGASVWGSRDLCEL